MKRKKRNDEIVGGKGIVTKLIIPSRMTWKNFLSVLFNAPLTLFHGGILPSFFAKTSIVVDFAALVL